MSKSSVSESPTNNSHLIGRQQLQKITTPPLPPLLDLALTRVYFNSISDAFCRLLLLFVQMLWISCIFFLGIELGKMVANLPQVPNIPAIQKGLLQIVAMVTTIIGAVFILLMMLPTLLAKTIKGILLTIGFYLFFGSVINITIIIVNFFVFPHSDMFYRNIALILGFATLFLWWIILINWLITTKQVKKQLIKNIIKMYELNFK